MRKLLIVLASIGIISFLAMAQPALAHRSGCHRWHSCPSDSGSYACGDLGYCSQCGNNYYCHNGRYSPGWNVPSTGANNTGASPTNRSVPQTFVGRPTTYTQLFSCAVGNYNSMIYHLKGSRFIKQMSLARKECFASELDAIQKGFKKARAR